jgi:threonine dehydrogenase-like Zn-dependent dehydrogenase
MSADYRAALLIGPEQITVSSLPRPTLAPGEVLVRIYQASLCPTDLKKYFHLDEKSAQALSQDTPVVLGHEAAGVVEEVGSAVEGVSPGQRVAIDPMLPCGECVYCKSGDFPMCLNLAGVGASAGSVTGSIRLLKEEGIGGCFAEYVKVPAANLYHLPDSLSLESAALMEPLADVLHSLEKGAPRQDETAVVIGLGGMGLMHVWAMSHRGVGEIVGIDPLPERRQMAESFGATTTLDPTAVDVVAALRALGDQAGPHVVFVCAGGNAQKPTTQQALKAIRKGGRVLLYASALKPADIPVDINNIHYGMITLTGTVGFYRRHAEQALQMLAEGAIDASCIRTPVFPLDQIQKAFALYGSPEVVKVGIEISAE